MDKKKFDPDDLQVIKAKIDLYKATIESLKKEHLAYQEILCQHDHYQKKKEVIPLNKFHNEEDYMENEYHDEEEYMESDYHDEEDYLESEYRDEDYMENEQLEENHYFTEQFDYLHGYLNELGQELLSLNKKIVLILKKQDQLLKNNDLKEIKEEIASLKKALKPKEAPAPPATKAPQGFSQLRNMVRSNSHVYDPNEQSRFQGLGNYPSPPRSHPSYPTQQGTSKGRRPLSPSKKSKTVKSNKSKPSNQRTTSNPKPPKSEGTTIKRKDDPDANRQKASLEINQQPEDSTVTLVKEVQEEILTNSQVKNKNMSKPKLLEKGTPSVVNTNSISNKEPLPIKEDVMGQPTPTETEPVDTIITSSIPNKEPLPAEKEGIGQPTPPETEPVNTVITSSIPNKEPLPAEKEGMGQPTPPETEPVDTVKTSAIPNKEPLSVEKEVNMDTHVSHPETGQVGNEGQIAGNDHLPEKGEKVIEPSSPETRSINVSNVGLEANERPIIETNLEEPKKIKEINPEEKTLKKSIELTTKNVETGKKPHVNSFLSLFQRG